MKKYALIISMMSLFLFVVIANAQEGENVTDTYVPTEAEIEEMESIYNVSSWQSPDEIEGLSDCFEYYTFQSVQISLEPENDSFLPGETARFSGYVENENDQPVVDGNIFVRISKKNNNYEAEGNFIVDEFVAKEKIALNPKEQKEIAISWAVPAGTSSGEYQADLFFSVGKKFNLGGLPFSNEIVGGTIPFLIGGDQGKFISFDRENTKLDGEKYNHIGDWPEVNLGEKSTITQPIINTFGEDKEIDVKYDLYYWDSLNEDDLIMTDNEKVVVPADGNLVLEYNIPEISETVYYIKITATGQDQKSIINLRFVSEKERPRLNYPAITKFPLKEGDDFTLFSCFHNTSSLNTEGRIEVSLKDKNNKEIGKIIYNGTIPSVMSASKVDMKSEKNYEYLKLEAKAYNKDDKMVDEYETIYDCKDFNVCEEESARAIGSTIDNFFSARNIIIIIFLIIISATIIVVMIEKNKK